MMCIHSFATVLALCVASSITAFTALPQQTHIKPALSNGHLERSLPLFTSASTSAEFELPDDAPNRNSRDTSSRTEPEETLSEVRKLRYQMEDEAKARFVSGDKLHFLRQKVLGMRDNLEKARKLSATGRVQELERAIIEAQQMDAEFVYSVAKERIAIALESGLDKEAAQWEREAKLARSVLPQFNLEGLWVGKYGDHGFEMINVTYAGDTLVAHKVTGKKNVPQGAVTFKVDLSAESSFQAKKLDPIELGDGAAKQWGTKYLQRFAGEGQVAAQGYRNSQWMEGHLILVSEYFSFAWLPIGHQVFFGRPSPELTLKLLREHRYGSTEDAIRSYLTKCLEETESLEDEMEVQEETPFRSHNQQDYYTQDGCFE